jgi:NTE family protein
MCFSLHFKYLMLLLFCCVQPGRSQRVGVVLSGGGASGIAHVGVLKALEEAQIPIDYIAGTSMGALVGGMYAMGYTPLEIEQVMLSEEFINWVNGRIDESYHFYYRQKDANSSWFNLKLRLDSTVRASLPTNLLSPISMDYAFMEKTAAISARAGYNFDSLFVPFRTVAADIHNKAEVVFRSGDLGQALRASSTYPFFFKPIMVDGKLLFDGGLYNNFPADVLYREFLPDVIIGSTVATEMKPPEEDDIFGQIKNMLMERTSYNRVCEAENMIIIKPEIPRFTILDFSDSPEMIASGYRATRAQKDSLYKMIFRKTDSTMLNARRKEFKVAAKPLIFDQISVEGLSKSQTKYVKRILGERKLPLSNEEIKPNYFRLATDNKLKKIYPSAQQNQSSENFALKLNAKANREWVAQFGGLFSSRPINTGFVSLHYNTFGRFGLDLDGNVFFGKFYSSTQAKTQVDFPIRFPFLIEADFTLNSYNYFNSASTFFEDIKPSYIVQYERYGNINLSLPSGNHTRLKLGGTGTRMFDDYYQTDKFTKADTADRTEFNHGSVWLEWERNTLNRKFYASGGSLLKLSIRYIGGQEANTPGSTSLEKGLFLKSHEFFRAKFTYESYYNKRGVFRPGIFAQIQLSNQPFFNNYTASLLAASAFSPIPESQTRFLPQFRAFNYAAGGARALISLRDRLELRLEAYVFQPYQEILNTNNTAEFGSPFAKRYFLGSAALVLQTPLAPLALSFNYLDQQEKPYTLLFTAGFLLYNKRAMD